MLRDGTRIQGEDHANSKLTEADVCEIRRLAAARTPHQVLAGRFGVSASNISMIVQRKTWSHIITADALPEKGVHRGESHRSAKLTEADVRKIRRLAEDRITQRTIAKQFGISNMAVNRIVRKTAWAHIS
jgi:IS30 family transposase